ncbi:DVUA0089 family protein [Salinimonas chungwhensis]|uniref:DVUA0089 family protein n=1 Tax=Salinimonas chungwhensis TaxID=265425 RepID=UPI0003633A9D|nr:DVUA0089 family protein [Salinimonas chungwhensis]
MLRKLLAITLFCCVSSAHASLINFTGNIAFHNDVVQINFSVAEDTENVRVWTDSHLGGENFDPITALWDGAGNLLDENDDDAAINPDTQTIFDSGFILPFLAAGDYIFTVATYSNFAIGDTLADGFAYDSEESIALSEWCQPANDCNEGTFWSVWLDGVTDADAPEQVAVPAPASALLILTSGILLLRRRT